MRRIYEKSKKKNLLVNGTYPKAGQLNPLEAMRAKRRDLVGRPAARARGSGYCRENRGQGTISNYTLKQICRLLYQTGLLQRKLFSKK